VHDILPFGITEIVAERKVAPTRHHRCAEQRVFTRVAAQNTMATNGKRQTTQHSTAQHASHRVYTPEEAASILNADCHTTHITLRSDENGVLGQCFWRHKEPQFDGVTRMRQVYTQAKRQSLYARSG
jgi:hypothetical protein